jgi:23S rRNA (cytidine1920-2'-O)/16S rRNA (cytidine1409-2'-O)-methyltransferase
MSIRADKLLYIKGLCKSRSAAQALIAEGKVLYNGKLIYKPSEPLDENGDITVTEEQKYVSRGGYKLEGALNEFKIDVTDDICIDIGASTGGFTDCLLQHGAKKVYAVDAGHGQLDGSLLNDARIINIENFNARELDVNTAGELCDTAVMDVSFISQTLLHKNVYGVLKAGGKFITLIKPQFEAGRENVNKRGIAAESSYEAVKNKVIASAEQCGFRFVDMDTSVIKGGDGNTEFIAYFIK